MIYKYKKYVESGPNGFMIRHTDIENTMDELGEIDGEIYVYSPTAVDHQDARLNWVEVVLDDDLRIKLRNSSLFGFHKNSTRAKIEEIGDIYDLLADAMKLIEFNMMLTSRLAGDVWGTHPIDAAKKLEYSTRNGAFLDAVGSGAVTLRGDFEDMNILMSKMMSRYSQINTVVRDNYISELQRIGL